MGGNVGVDEGADVGEVLVGAGVGGSEGANPIFDEICRILRICSPLWGSKIGIANFLACAIVSSNMPITCVLLSIIAAAFLTQHS